MELAPNPAYENQNLFGKAYRVVIAVHETIKGPEKSEVALLLNLQHTHEMEYFRDQKIEFLLATTTHYVDEESEISYDEPNVRHAFRILEPIKHPKDQPDTEWIGKQLNVSLDEGRMFDLHLDVISKRSEILKRARAYAKKYPYVLPVDHVYIPKEYGIKCGYTNAYCGITLPISDESKALAIGLSEDPGRLLRNVKRDDLARQKKAVLESLQQFLAQFEDTAPKR